MLRKSSPPREANDSCFPRTARRPRRWLDALGFSTRGSAPSYDERAHAERDVGARCFERSLAAEEHR